MDLEPSVCIDMGIGRVTRDKYKKMCWDRNWNFCLIWVNLGKQKSNYRSRVLAREGNIGQKVEGIGDE